jgi:RNA polymerase sigma-70 factor (ECF subfamily)
MAVLWGAGADADDVVQDAFVRAYAGLGGFRTDGQFRAWLLAIVRNETRNLFRSRRRRSAREELTTTAELCRQNSQGSSPCRLRDRSATPVTP